MKKIKVLITDDHPMMREALLAALEDEPNIEVVGEASSGFEVFELLKGLAPDVVLMDLLMPGMSGLDVIAELQKDHQQIKVLVVSSLEDEEKILAAIQAGALGYFPKTAPRSYLIEAIQKVADGVPYLPSGIAAKLFKSLREMKRASSPYTEGELLTARQAEILALLGEGRSDQEIGSTLHLTEATVRSHVHHILQRLGLETRAQAAAYANQNRKMS